MFASLLLLAWAVCALAAPARKRNVPPGVPSYVVKYAPMVQLYSTDPYRPSDIGAQITNTLPEINFTTIPNAASPLTLNNLASLNQQGGEDVYLTSNDNVDDNPAWLNGVTPDASGETENAVSCAIIINDHGNGEVDAFYMYFYAFNYGGTYFGFTIGDHVGDWEYNMIRFQNGQPHAVWYSQHSNGQAFHYQTTMKYQGGVRPLVFSANGSHANYAIPGTHGHGIPNLNLPDGPVNDYTDYGPLWDPTLSAYFFSYNARSNNFSAYDSATPVDWLHFAGKWGDEQYPDSDPRQQTVLGIDGLAKYVGGPTGPADKGLQRKEVCPDNGILCIVRWGLSP